MQFYLLKIIFLVCVLFSVDISWNLGEDPPWTSNLGCPGVEAWRQP
jgi:hypothetical protein